jgi:dodecin
MGVYRVTDLIGTSTQSWEDAASTAIRAASGTLRDLRVAEMAQPTVIA